MIRILVPFLLTVLAVTSSLAQQSGVFKSVAPSTLDQITGNLTFGTGRALSFTGNGTISGNLPVTGNLTVNGTAGIALGGTGFYIGDVAGGNRIGYGILTASTFELFNSSNGYAPLKAASLFSTGTITAKQPTQGVIQFQWADETGGNRWSADLDGSDNLAFYNFAGGTVKLRLANTTGDVSVLSTTISSATTNGALVVSGGIGIAGQVTVGGGAQIAGTPILPAAWSGGYGIGLDGALTNRRIFYGDGTGYDLRFSTRAGSVTTDRMTLSDAGRLTVTENIVATGSITNQSASSSSPALLRALVPTTATANAYFSAFLGGKIDWQFGAVQSDSSFRLSSNGLGTSDALTITSAQNAIFSGSVRGNSSVDAATVDGLSSLVVPAFHTGVTAGLTRNLFGFGSTSRAGLLRGYQDGGGLVEWSFGRWQADAFTEFLKINNNTVSVIDSTGVRSLLVGSSSSSGQAARLGNSRLLNYQDVLVSRNLRGVAGADSYQTEATAGYAGMEFFYDGGTDKIGTRWIVSSAAQTANTPFIPTYAMTLSNAGNLSLAGNLTVAAVTSTGPQITISNSVAAGARGVNIQTSGVNRWLVYADGGTESGANAGSNFSISAYTDAGAFLSTPLTIIRSTGLVNFGKAITLGNDASNVAAYFPTGMAIRSGVAGSTAFLDLGNVTLRDGDATASASAKFTINHTTASTSTTTGALVVGGGIGAAGRITAGGEVYAANRVDASGTNAYFTATDGAVVTKLQSILATPAGYVGTQSNHDLLFYTNNTNRGSISAAGAWTLAGNTAITGSLTFNNLAYDNKIVFNRTGGKQFIMNLDASQFYIYNNTDAINVLNIANNGNTTLAGNLTVNGGTVETNGGAGTAYHRLTNTASGSGAGNGLTMEFSGGTTGWLWNYENGDLVFGVNNVEGARLKAGSGLQFKGTTTNDSASAGYVGEYVSSTVNSASAITLTTLTGANVTSLSLTAGDWDVSGTIAFQPTDSPTITFIAGGATTTSATSPPETNRLQIYSPSNAGTAINPFPTMRFSLSATTTVYLTAYAQFSGGTSLKAYGYIAARRVR